MRKPINKNKKKDDKHVPEEYVFFMIAPFLPD